MLFSLIVVIYALCAVASSRAVDVLQQAAMILEAVSPPREVPGGSIVKLCPESRDTDLLVIERMYNQPQIPYLDDDGDLLIWGNLTQDVSRNSTVNYQINATANNGDSGALKGTFHICDYLEKMHRSPNWTEPNVDCPPNEGPIFIDYAYWFSTMLVAPGQWSVKFDAKTPEGDRIYCLETQFDLQCRPEHDGPECMRNVTDTPKIDRMTEKPMLDEL